MKTPTLTELNAIDEILRRAEAREQREARRAPIIHGMASALAALLIVTMWILLIVGAWKLHRAIHAEPVRSITDQPSTIH